MDNSPDRLSNPTLDNSLTEPKKQTIPSFYIKNDKKMVSKEIIKNQDLESKVNKLIVENKK